MLRLQGSGGGVDDEFVDVGAGRETDGKGNGLGDGGGSDHAATGRLRPELLPDGGVGGSGEEGDDADGAGAEFFTEGFGEGKESALGGVVGGHAGKGGAGGDAEVVDDDAALCEIGEHGLGDEEGSVEVGVDDLAPGIEVEGGDGG